MWSLVAPQATNVNSDLGCCRTTDLDMILISSQGSDVTMSPGGNTGYSDQHGSSGGMVLRHQYGLRW